MFHCNNVSFSFLFSRFFKDTVSLETKVLKRWNGVRLKALEIDQCRRKPASMEKSPDLLVKNRK